MQILCNGQPREVPPDTSIASLLAALKLTGPVAVEVNERLAPRETHAQWRLAEGDAIEVVTLVGGG
ncbi:MAG: sulfur carrier protein ThiS [Planctomycetales bacterium]|nr:sulfur carrier protein ThiS [Planctomycetales bacterium]